MLPSSYVDKDSKVDVSDSSLGVPFHHSVVLWGTRFYAMEGAQHLESEHLGLNLMMTLTK